MRLVLSCYRKLATGNARMKHHRRDYLHKHDRLLLDKMLVQLGLTCQPTDWTFLKVCCDIWHIDVSRGSLKVGVAGRVSNPRVWREDLGNQEGRSTHWTCAYGTIFWRITCLKSCVSSGGNGVMLLWGGAERSQVQLYLGAKISDADTFYFFLPLTFVTFFFFKFNFKSKLESPKAGSKESFQLLPEETLNRTQLFILDVAFDIGGVHAARDY